MTAALIAGACCVPHCVKNPNGAAMCCTCWFDLTEDERAAVRLAQESPFEPGLHALESALALQATGMALDRRRQRKSAEKRMKQIRASQMARYG